MMSLSWTSPLKHGFNHIHSNCFGEQDHPYLTEDNENHPSSPRHIILTGSDRGARF